jgi:hypothetical protein
MKKILAVFILMLSLGGCVHRSIKNQIKGNMLFAPLGILNVGYEHAFNRHWTGQADVLISPWKSFAGRHCRFIWDMWRLVIILQKLWKNGM